MMAPIGIFSPAFVVDPGKDYATRFELLESGNPTGLILDGDILAAQFRIEDDGYLLVTDARYTLHNSLNFYYLTSTFQLRDKLHFSAWDAGGILCNLVPAGERSIRFTFFTDDDRWELQVLRDAEVPQPLQEDMGRIASWINRHVLRFRREEAKYLVVGKIEPPDV